MDIRLIDSRQSKALQRLMESNAQYSRLVEGRAPVPTAASDALTAQPPNVSCLQKVDLGLWDGQELVAFADVIIGWPAKTVAHLGLLMTDGARQGEILGRMMHDAVIDLVAQSSDIKSLRLSVVDTNADLAEPFWKNLGYVPTGESEPYVSGTVESTSRIWLRPGVVD